MKRKYILIIHITATIIAALTIANFFTFSLIAEIYGNPLFIKQVKTTILYALPLMIIAMPMLVISGKKLAGKSKSPLVIIKQKRMKFIAINGVMLISLAIYLYYHANFKIIDTTFLVLQILELTLGLTNLILLGSNIKTGMKLSGRLKI